jgi:hypothetical protein
MPKIYPTITRMLAVTMFVTGAFADTVTLKSGEHLEGKITKETDKEITIEVRVSAGVIDERVVPKAEIEKIDKITPEVEAYQAIVSIKLEQNSLSAAQYDPYIRAFQAFVTQYPNSIRAIDVQTTLNAFQEEKKRVEAGEVKINGEWISKSQAEKEKVQIGGRLAFNYMLSQNAAGDHVGALNTFAALEKTYPGAAVMPDAIELAQKLLVVLRTEVEQAIPAQKAYKENLEKGFATASPADRAEMTAAFKREQEAGDAVVAAADTAGRWAPFNKHNAKCLASLKSRVLKEEPRLAKLEPEKMRQSLQLTDTARQSLASGDADAASKTLKDATMLWPANELANRLAKDAAAELKTATTTPAPAAPTPKPAATPKPKTTPRPSAAQPATSSSGTTAKEDDDRPFYMTLPGAIGIVAGLAVVLAGANIFWKMKKRKAEQAE